MITRTLLLLGFFTLLFLFAHPGRSKKEGHDMICSSADPDSCYTRLFQPTAEFQAIQAGQNLPAGLHVRLNLETGVKEAKLYDAREDDSQTEAVVFEKQVEGEEKQQQKQIVLGPDGEEPPPYSNTGKILPPNDGFVSAGTFQDASNAVAKLSIEDSALMGPLTELEDLAHDIYYGNEIISSTTLTQKVLAILSSSSSESAQSMAATLLGSALRNNHKALETFVKAHPGAIDALLLQITGDTPTNVKVKIVYLLSSLMAGPEQAVMFRVFNGHVDLLKVFDAPHTGSNDGKDALRSRIARLIGDWPDEESYRWCEPLQTAQRKLSKGDVRESIDEALASLKAGQKC
ncbi:MAG: hypothetical protein M1814_005734 [Vezdaea aestivalis]|nr:MAG: hypothetical protein M1814_005734 [Vezdaea aestivalis]